jgi:hypothetical protein
MQVVVWLEGEGADNIISGANHPFCLAILGRSVRARESKANAKSGKEIPKGGGEKFSSIITLEALYGHMILSMHECEKSLKSDACVRFFAQGKCPRVVCEIIKHNQVIFITRKANNGGGPQITMNKLKSSGSTRVRDREGESSMVA